MFRLDVPNVMSDSVDEKKLTSEAFCRRERVNENLPKYAWILCIGHNLLLAEVCAL